MMSTSALSIHSEHLHCTTTHNSHRLMSSLTSCSGRYRSHFSRKHWTPQHVPPSHPEPKATVHPCTVRALTQDAVSLGYKVLASMFSFSSVPCSFAFSAGLVRPTPSISPPDETCTSFACSLHLRLLWLFLFCETHFLAQLLYCFSWRLFSSLLFNHPSDSLSKFIHPFLIPSQPLLERRRQVVLYPFFYFSDASFQDHLLKLSISLDHLEHFVLMTLLPQLDHQLLASPQHSPANRHVQVTTVTTHTDRNLSHHVTDIRRHLHRERLRPIHRDEDLDRLSTRSAFLFAPLLHRSSSCPPPDFHPIHLVLSNLLALPSSNHLCFTLSHLSLLLSSFLTHFLLTTIRQSV